MIELAATGDRAGLWCECVTDFSRLPDLAPDWQRLTSQDPQSEIFHLWGWASAFSKTYASALSPCVFVVHRGERVAGILPLVRRGKRLEFLGSPHSDYNDLLCEERDAAAVLEVALDSLLHWQGDWEFCTLDKVPSHSRIVRYWRGLPSSQRKRLQLIFLCPCPTILLNEDRGAMPKKLTGKRDQRHHLKLLQKRGRLTFRHLETREEAREHIRRLFDQHITRYACSGILSQFLQPEPRRFFEALIEELDPRTQLRFAVLEVDNQPVAYHFGFRQNGKHTHYKPTFDVDHWESGPGDVLLQHLFQHALETGLGEFDFTVGDESYKYRFANRTNKNYTLYVDRYPARVTTVLRRLERLARQAARENPALKSVIQRTGRHLKDVLSPVSALLRGRGQRRRYGNAVWAMCRNAVWAQAEVQFFSSTPHPRREAPDDVAITPGSLAGLARISLEYPESLNEAVLRDYRGRLRRGDRVFVARCADGETYILWVGRAEEIPVAEIGPRCKLRLPEPASVIYDVWASSGSTGRGARPEILRGVAQQCADLELWTYCLGDQPAACRAVAEAGFRLRQRMEYRAWLHWFQRSRVKPETEAIGSGREAAAA
jgi:CelD/BcsL family acetyltransferase involved in cellulose biosynthesis